MGTTKTQIEPTSTKSAPIQTAEKLTPAPEQRAGPVRAQHTASSLPPPNGSPPPIRGADIMSATDELQQAPKRARMSATIQRLIGNTHAMRMFGGLQAKIAVGASGDRYEQEADDAASRVVSGQRVARISRIAAVGVSSPKSRQEPEEEELQMRWAQRQPEEVPWPEPTEEDRVATKNVQAKAEPGGAGAIEEAGTEARIKSPGGGRPLPEGIRTEMEAGLGADFSDVRVHDTAADRADARRLNAKAFTYGDQVWMGPGASVGDRKLMAHELTHVVQQGAVRRCQASAEGPRTGGPGVIQLSPLSDQLEQVWSNQGKGVFFERLRNLSRPVDVDVHTFVRDNLVGDDRWLAQNLLTHGREINWPIHLRVEREMKGWGDSGGKGVVFDILRTANGADAANSDLTTSLNRIFSAGSDDIWLALYLQAHGAEANWPIHLRVEREMKGWADCGGKGEVFNILRAANATQAANAALTATLDRIFTVGSDDLWLAQNLQTYGPETNWPQHVGTRIPGTATQAAIHSELYPARGAPGAPVAAWDGALTAGLTPTQTTAALAARTTLINAMHTALNANLAAVMPRITAAAARRRVPIASLEGAGQAAKSDADAQYSGYAAVAALTGPQQAARAAYTISATGAGQNLFDAQDPAHRATVGMAINPTDLASWMAETVPGCVTARNTHHLDPTRSVDERTFLRTQIIAPFVAANDADLRAFDLHGFALSNPRTGQIVLPTAVPAGLSDTEPAPGVPSDAERGRKWRAWRTMVHEYIHQLEHPALRAWPGRNRTISEGFTEYFTKKVLLPLLPTVAGNSVTRRTRIEGADNGAPSAAIVGGVYSPGSYANYLTRVENIEGHLGGASVGAQNAMKAIFFQGHLEYLGYDTQGNQLTAPAGPQDQIGVPASVTTFAALATAMNVAEADLRTANPGATEPLSGRMRAPGCREHRVVIAGARGSGASGETLSVIATQHVVLPSALRAANPGVNFATLGEGDIVIIPRH